MKRYIVLSSAIQAQLRLYGVPAAAMRVIPSCVEEAPALVDRPSAKARWRKELGLSPAATLIGFCGHLTAEKGADTLL